MKRLLAIAFVALAPATVFAGAGPLPLIVSNGITFSTNPTVNLQGFNTPQSEAANLSAQVSWSSANFSTSTFTDGSASTATVIVNQMVLAIAATDQITVPSTALILGAPATAQYTIISNTDLSGHTSSATVVISSNVPTATLSIGGQFFFNLGQGGTNWTQGLFSSNTASNLAAAIPVVTGGLYTGNLTSVTNSTGVVIAAVSSSTIYNGYYIFSSTPAAISTATMRGGTNPASVQLNGLAIIANKDWNVGTSVTQTASNMAAAFNADFASIVVATNVAGVVFTSATVNGTAGNSYTTATSSPSAISTTTFSGGLNRALLQASLTINGIVYENGDKWTDQSNTSTGTAVSIATFMNTLGVIVSTTGNASVIFSTASPAGAAGNLNTLSGSAAFTITSPNFKGGQDPTSLTVNGKTFVAGVSFSTGSVTTDATNLASAIASSSKTINVTATSAGATVFATSTISGILTNYPLSTNNTNYLTLSSSTLLGGTNAAYAPGSGVISLPNHGFTTGLPVLLSTNSATIAPLVNATVYYVVVVDSNDVALSTTQALALAGSFVTITSSGTAGLTAHALTLGPLGFFPGSSAGFWQVSNDNSFWTQYTLTAANIPVNTQSFATAIFPSTTSVQDFGRIDYGYIRYNFTGPTSGGVALRVILNAKD